MIENRDQHGLKAAERGRRALRGSDDARAREAASILKRLREETEPQVGAGTGRLLTQALAHLAARDADRDDPLEVLGTRIGRILAVLLVAVLAMSLASFLLRS